MHDNPIITLFNDIASSYDVLNHVFSFNLDRYWRIIAIRAIGLHPDAALLDCCTGTADMAIAAARSHRGAIYGIDLSEKMLMRAQQKISEKPFGERMLLLEADAQQLPFLNGSIDAVTMGFGLRNLLNREQGIREITRVLKDYGQLVILEFAPPRKNLFGFLYRLYLRIVIPLIGKFVSRSHSAYRYLYTSIEQFLQPEEIVQLLGDNDLHIISTRQLIFGVVYLYIARRGEMPKKKFHPGVK